MRCGTPFPPALCRGFFSPLLAGGLSCYPLRTHLLETFTFVEHCVVLRCGTPFPPAFCRRIFSPLLAGGASRFPLLFEGVVCPGVCQALPCSLLAPSALLIKQAVHGAFTHVSGFGLFFLIGECSPLRYNPANPGVFRPFATYHPSGLKPRPIVFSIKLRLGL